MSYLLGVVLFALAILISVSLHEAGHMLTAKAFGMKVTRYFVGFGPTLWSFKRGETEYGIKGIPLGGFCKIVGMTPQDDDVEPGDEKRAMWRYPVWKRTIVMSAGSITHFALALIALWIIAITAGLPNPKFPSTEDGFKAEPAVIALAPCVVVENAARACQADDPASPAEKAQLKDGDRITAVNGRPVSTWGDMLDVVRATPPGAATVTFERDGRPQEARVDLAAVQRPPLDDPKGATSSVSALGVALRPSTPPRVEYGPIAAFGATADFTGTMAVQTAHAMQRIPQKVPALWSAITGSERDMDTPISVVGATRLGGEAVENNAWLVFFMLFVSLNFFIGVFNLLPLLPLDGGHIAIAWFERARSWLYARIGRRDPGRVDYLKLMPFTYAVILIGGAFTLLTVTADVINPITLFSR
ncbi:MULTISPECIES: M50 family metallopeptidase [Micromonospora]|uniref:PDZ domain-containing protein n=1 Tax=Micromonospora chalcea TaxID=1874 RepID=A0ABX9Y0M7_MICCH|nr:MULTISPECIES: site-2 protease family protein [Micromonospora]EWM65407.1 PDZ domain family protein [Micromonospora sp. M42]MBQ1060019.1 site-2 protease family protein [Micromonospora sp. C41]MCK1805551.1 site-2 protease family protein [Micromonospora sp. R42106]MCK1834482.1 site-2 protease family protein [Micromonospora sp. R42003]MCK1844434.1 site-2 protease family protein [Micromonospora sp. R42004]